MKAYSGSQLTRKTRHYMEVGSRIHTPSTLAPNEDLFVPFYLGGREDGRVGLYASE